jgi:hypothetical protein
LTDGAPLPGSVSKSAGGHSGEGGAGENPLCIKGAVSPSPLQQAPLDIAEILDNLVFMRRGAVYHNSKHPASARAKERTTKVLAPRPVTRRDVLKFTDHCVLLRATWAHYQELFEASALRLELLESTANTFFHDLNLIFIQHLILQICKLTDSEATRGTRNLTTWFLLKNSDFSSTPSVPRKLTQLIKSLERFSETPAARAQQVHQPS